MKKTTKKKADAKKVTVKKGELKDLPAGTKSGSVVGGRSYHY